MVEVREKGSGWPVPLVQLKSTHQMVFTSDPASPGFGRALGAGREIGGVSDVRPTCTARVQPRDGVKDYDAIPREPGPSPVLLLFKDIECRPVDCVDEDLARIRAGPSSF